jgi:hypothetical protein
VPAFIAVEIAPAATVLMASHAGSEVAAGESAGVIEIELPRVGGVGYPAASIPRLRRRRCGVLTRR